MILDAAKCTHSGIMRVVLNPDPSLFHSAGCIALPRAGDAIHPVLQKREGSGFETIMGAWFD